MLREILLSLTLGLPFAACYGGSGCFPAGTSIRTPTGAAPIETLQVGDAVVGYDLGTHAEVTVHVAKTHVRSFSLPLRKLELHGGGELVATPDHPLYSMTRQNWAKAGDVAAGETLVTSDGTRAVDAADASGGAAPTQVYNIETDGVGTYFADGVLAKYY